MAVDGIGIVPPSSKVTPGWMSFVETVVRDEPCWSIEELNVGGNRFQIIVVNRGDALAACYLDLGPSKTREFAWLCAFDHSVAEALDWADDQREDDYWAQYLAEQEANSTLVADFYLQNDMLAKYAKTNRRTIKALRSAKSKI